MDIKQKIAQAIQTMDYRWPCAREYAEICRDALAEIERLEELLRPVRLLEAVESMAQNNRRIADAADRISGHLERMGFK